MAGLEWIFTTSLTTQELCAVQRHLMGQAAAPQAPAILLLHGHRASALSLGRYHFRPAGWDAALAYRRTTGGRSTTLGPGWMGLALMLRGPESLAPDGRRAPMPEQVINRCCRGLLSGLRGLGIAPYYPGRDAISAGGRELALCSFDAGSAGGLIFEALIEFDSAESKRDRVSVKRPDWANVVSALVDSHSAIFGPGRQRDLGAEEVETACRVGFEPPAPDWLENGRDQSMTWVQRKAQIGIVEAAVRLAGNGAIDEVFLAGDIIANGDGLERFRAEVRGIHPSRAELKAAAARIYLGGADFLLGLGPLDNLADLVSQAAQAARERTP